MNTALNCQRCGRQCGSAHRDGNNAVVIALRNARRAGVQRVTFPPGGQLWPLEWPCRRCQTTIRLDPAQLQRVGRTKHVVCAIVDRT